MANNTNATNNSAKDRIAMLRGLRQSRQFSDKPVPDDVINDILEVGRWTGSGMNRQPWDFVLIRNRDTLRKLAEEEAKNSHLINAQFATVIVMANEMKEIETYDEARLAERMMLAAAAHGVAAGIWWFKDGGAAARRLLGIPQEKSVRTAISFGYPLESASTAPRSGGNGGRRPLSEVVHREKY